MGRGGERVESSNGSRCAVDGGWWMVDRWLRRAMEVTSSGVGIGRKGRVRERVARMEERTGDDNDEEEEKKSKLEL